MNRIIEYAGALLSGAAVMLVVTLGVIAFWAFVGWMITMIIVIFGA